VDLKIEAHAFMLVEHSNSRHIRLGIAYLGKAHAVLLMVQIIRRIHACMPRIISSGGAFVHVSRFIVPTLFPSL
jgi:hypothetical protein